MSDKFLEMLQGIVETSVKASVEAKNALDLGVAETQRLSARVETLEDTVARAADALERIAKAEEALVVATKAKVKADTKAAKALSARLWGLLSKAIPFLLPALFGAGGIAGGAWGMNEYKPVGAPPAIVEPIEVPNVQP